MPRAAKHYNTKSVKWNESLPCRSYHHLYDTVSWKKIRISFLSDNPLCVECLKDGHYKMAKIVDHLVPHKGDINMFYDLNNLQALCKKHHDRKTFLETRS